MAFNAGAIEARLTLDRTAFTAGLRAAKAQAEEFARRKFEVKITPKIDRSELTRIKAEIERVTGNIRIKVSLDNASLQAVKARIDRTVGNIRVKVGLDQASRAALEAQLNRLRATINVNLRITAAEKARIKAEIERISPTIVIRLRYDRDTLEELIRRLREAGEAGRRAGDDSNQSFGRMDGTLRALMITAPLLGPALAVGLNAAVGSAGALLSIVGTLAPAFGALALVAVPLWKDIQAGAQGSYEEIRKLPPGIREASFALKDLQRDLDYLKAQTTPEVGNMFAAGFRAAQAAIHPLIPLIKQTALGATDVANKFKDLFNSAQYQGFVDFLSKNIRPMLDKIGDILVNTTKGVMSLVEAFHPLADWILDKINVGMADFAKWAAGLANDPAFKKWIEDVKVDLELLWKFLVQVVEFIAKLVVELEPLGRPIMQGLIAALDFLNSLPPGMLGAIAMGLTGIFSALILGAGGPVALGIGAITAAATALAYLYQNSDTAKQKMDEFVTWLQATWNPIWEVIRTNFDEYIKPAFDRVVAAVRDNLWPALVQLGEAINTYVIPYLLPLADTLTKDVIPALLNFLEHLIKLVAYLTETFGPVIADIFGRVVGIIDGALKAAAGVINTFIGLVTGDWDMFGKGIQQITEGFWTAVAGVFGMTLDELKAKMHQWDTDINQLWTDIGNKIKEIWNNVGNWFTTQGTAFLDTVKQRFSEFGPFVQRIIQQAADGIGQAWRAVANFFREPINWVIRVVINDGILNAWNTVMGWIGAPALSAAPMGELPAFASGGLVSGPGTGTSDSVLARVSAGEYIVPAAVARSNMGLLSSLPSFATGGPVPPPGSVLGTGQAGATVAPGTTATAPTQSWWDRVGANATSLFNGIKNYASMPALGSVIGNAITGMASALVNKALSTLRDKLINIFPPAAPGAENLDPAGNDPRISTVFDRGGILRPRTKPINTSGHAERVLSPKQTQDFNDLTKILNDMFHPTKTKSPTGGDIYHITLPKGASVRELANEIAFRKKVTSKGRYSPR
jgi:hypothetical protein